MSDSAARGSRVSLRVGLIAATVALLVLGAVMRWTAPEAEKKQAPGARPSLVETARVEARALTPRARLAGVLEPRRDVELFAETGGKILEAGAEELDAVRADQVLVRIDPTLAEVALERAEAGVARTESELELAHLNLERRRSLVDRQVASAADLDAAENAERIARAALREARAMRDEARDQLAKKTVVAPFDGVLREFPVEKGEYVRPGQRLGELLDLSAVRITVGLSDRQVVAVRAGALAEVEVEALPGRRFEGTVLRVGSASDAETKKFPVEVEVANPEGRLLPGMVARVILDLGVSEPVALIPRDATQEEFGLRFVYVVKSNGDGTVAVRRGVQVREVPFEPRLFQVDAGLDAGEEIVTTGLRQLRDGAPIERKAGTPAAQQAGGVP